MFGGGPSTKWGQAIFPYTMTWGTTKWGEDSFRVVFGAEILLSNSLAPSATISNETQKIIQATLTFAGAMNSEVLTNGDWRIVFVSDTTNVQDRDMATWTEVQESVTTFVCLAAGSTTWT
jgi:hypothetical protein